MRYIFVYIIVLAWWFLATYLDVYFALPIWYSITAMAVAIVLDVVDLAMKIIRFKREVIDESK